MLNTLFLISIFLVFVQSIANDFIIKPTTDNKTYASVISDTCTFGLLLKLGRVNGYLPNDTEISITFEEDYSGLVSGDINNDEKNGFFKYSIIFELPVGQYSKYGIKVKNESILNKFSSNQLPVLTCQKSIIRTKSVQVITPINQIIGSSSQCEISLTLNLIIPNDVNAPENSSILLKSIKKPIQLIRYIVNQPFKSSENIYSYTITLVTGIVTISDLSISLRLDNGQIVVLAGYNSNLVSITPITCTYIKVVEFMYKDTSSKDQHYLDEPLPNQPKCSYIVRLLLQVPQGLPVPDHKELTILTNSPSVTYSNFLTVLPNNTHNITIDHFETHGKFTYIYYAFVFVQEYISVNDFQLINLGNQLAASNSTLNKIPILSCFKPQVNGSIEIKNFNNILIFIIIIIALIIV